ncbi:MAG TPA: sensor histidine kinase [Tahibacter sp.]|uniref:HAMP domain-containing sensor histidine kinase n=1 Tax=Tahibacter sp. TaxID=2056211 RepID=UPI002BF52F28|nr:sensor histidine kinase [Tahibacter sp.]HSX60453.1 sensor histidine kinase [Tahibacter sp.]
MSQRRFPLQGLTLKLALFYLLLSVPALALIQWTIVSFEFHELFEAVDSGRMTSMTQDAAREMGRYWNSDRPPGHIELATRAEALVLRLERPQDGLAPSSYVMLELSTVPIAVGVYDAAGRALAHAPENSWTATPPAAAHPAWEQARRTGTADLEGEETPERVRRVLAAIPGTDGQVRGFLLTELRLPLPWQRIVGGNSFEWPILLVYLVVFSIATAFFMVRWVTRRLNTIADAAESWSAGDFSTLIPDESGDELGRLSRDLNRMAVELMSLMESRAELASLQERQRIARDLHDTVKQKAFALNLQIRAARRLIGSDDEAAKTRLDESFELINGIQRQLVHVLDELRSERAPGGFLAPRLRDLAERWARISGLQREFDLDDSILDHAVHGEALLRIAEEALANVLRHSRATRVSIRLHRKDEQIALSIADNGIGGADSSSGMGLANMRSRAEGLPGGQFELISSPGQGTEVRVRCNYGARQQ